MSKPQKHNSKSSSQDFISESDTESVSKDKVQPQITSEQINQQVNLGVKYCQSGQFPEAQACFQQVLQWQPDNPDAWHLLGILAAQQKRYSNAISKIKQAIKLNPKETTFYSNLGNVYLEKGHFQLACDCYQKALQIQPHDQGIEQKLALASEKILDLGIEYHQAGRFSKAELCYQQVLKYQPNCADAWHLWGVIAHEKDDYANAMERINKAIKLSPNTGNFYNSLGSVFQKQKSFAQAIESYQRALQLKPDYINAHYNLGNTYREQGKLENAIESYQRALQLEPDYAKARISICISQLPIIYSTSEEVRLSRQNYQQHLQNLVNYYARASETKRANAADAVGSIQPFFLAYQGLNDQQLQKTYGHLICQFMSSRYPQWSRKLELPPLAGGEKIRIGFVSGFFYNHSNWKLPLKGWIENLDPNKFELFGYYTRSTQDKFTTIAQKFLVKFIQGSMSVEEWCEAISQDKLHILIFPEFGMEPMTIQLGCLRLAPIQITSWGHPDTSGLPTIDYYLSSDLMEPDNAQQHYSEKLVRLPNLSIHYSPVQVQAKEISKTEIGIEDDEIMFWCCQNLSKYLPEHDDFFSRIAKELTRCKFVFIKYQKGEYVTEIFQQRLSQAFAEFELNYQDYCIFLPRLDNATFAGTTAIADIFLDSIGWSGCNSTLEAIDYNIPILTLPGDLMRGRHTLAILKMMGIEETIASNKDEYVQMAIRLAQDAQYRQYISQQIAENKHKLYSDLKPIRALEDFLVNLVEQTETTTSSQSVHTSSSLTQPNITSQGIIHKTNEVDEIRIGNHLFPSIPPISDSNTSCPFWSVVIPVYNRTKYLKKCLNSVLSCWTNEKDMEIIVVDDGGTVPLADLVQEWGQGIVRYHRLPRNYGLPDSWNQGIKLTRGYWVHLLHDDDYVLPEFYKRFKQTLMQIPESVGAAFTGYENVNEKGEITFQQKVFGNYEGIVAQDVWLSRIGVGNPLNMSAVVVKRSTYECLGGFHPDLTFTSDWELWKRVATFCDWWYCPDVLAHYRQHCESKTVDLSKTGAQVTSIRKAIEISATYFPEEISAQITTQSRRHYFQYCLNQIDLLLKKGNSIVALHLLKEALKIDTSPQSISSLLNLLSQEAYIPLGQAIFQELSFSKSLSKELAELQGDNLSSLALAFGTDKEGDHFYSQHYQQHFESLRLEKLNILEIGIGGYKNPQAGGESLRMWKAYFPNSRIFGIDIYDKTYHDEYRIKTFRGSQVDEEFLQKVVAEIGEIDIIIDDGSHYNHHVIKTFKILFPLMSNNGIYVIEDLQTSYWEEVAGIKWGGSKDLTASHTSMNFFKSLIDGLNYEEFTLDEYTASYFDKHIISMHFYHNLVFIYKGLNNEGSNILGKR